MPGGWVDPTDLAKGPNGRSLCRWCNLEVPAGRRRTFCSEFCVNEWRLRSNPGYLRDQVFARDRGVCARCGIDCVAEWRRLKRLRGPRRTLGWAEWGLKPGRRSTLWDADHILPVAEGGGECDLSNIRTLCVRCHQRDAAKPRNFPQVAAADHYAGVLCNACHQPHNPHL